MPIETDPKTGRHRWKFKATIHGKLYRRSKQLPEGWSRAEADAFNTRETAKLYKELSEGSDRVPLIDQVVALYIDNVVPERKDGKQAARCLAYTIDFWKGRGLDELGAISREVKKASRALGLAERTIKQRLAYLRAAAYYAQKFHSVGRLDWIAQMEIPGKQPNKTHFMTRADILRLARAVKDRETRAWILMTFCTGSRPGECHRASARDGKGLFLGEDKNGNPIIKPVVVKMRRYLKHWPLLHDYTYYCDRFNAAKVKVGLDKFTPHDCRHATASALIDEGASLEQVAHVLDHKCLASTQIYTHLAVESKLRLLERVSRKRPMEPISPLDPTPS